MMKLKARMIHSSGPCPAAAVASVAKMPVSTRMPTSVPRLSTWRPGSRIGEPDMRPDSLRKAMIEPEKVIAPMATPRPISTRDTARMAPASSTMPKAAGLR